MYYLKLEEKMFGPLAPDNPKYSFEDQSIYFKAHKWASELNRMFSVKYTVVYLNPENNRKNI